ncbi:MULTISPECIES: c-type cytochrome [Chloroflexus]|uniref:Cytochrome c class I n=1 Tax=Chloroflexus aggregans (strain MD-66 / DSM 9485) TaxID=326427 RepID=B8G4P7_CHLAD|nr:MULTISPECIES: cytochrome c [Chloroflexus]ACL25523.1 cytochrome c class I [Chloroflexus aggregans DSM 9485]GIV88144.1 MAG: cytochrome c [Chloroflexus sp.]GIV88157.1 MAG: cytochrome c [Chloroflexus sp.]
MNRTIAWAFTLLLIGLLTACGGNQQTSSSAPVTELPAALADTSLSSKGDPKRGKELFGPCAACHTTSKEVLVGPGLAGLFSASGPVLPKGVDYNGMLPNGKERSEANIAEWIRTGGTGRIGYMPSHNLTDQEMADLLAYLRTLK